MNILVVEPVRCSVVLGCLVQYLKLFTIDRACPSRYRWAARPPDSVVLPPDWPEHGFKEILPKILMTVFKQLLTFLET